MGNIELGNKLKEIRERNNLSVQELADCINVSESSIYKWEQGTLKPSLNKLDKILNIDGTNIVELLDMNHTRIIHIKEQDSNVPKFIRKLFN